MPIDTEQKRRSALRMTLPLPDGALDQADRQHVAWQYTGILADLPIPIPVLILAVPGVLEPAFGIAVGVLEEDWGLEAGVLEPACGVEAGVLTRAGGLTAAGLRPEARATRGVLR